MATARTARGRLPRLLCRALVVVGGALIATVAAWLISSASASADQLPATPPAGPVTTALDVAAGTLHSIGVPTHTAVTDSLPPLPHVPSAAVTGALRTAVGKLGAHVPSRPVVAPAAPVAPPVARKTPAPVRPAEAPVVRHVPTRVSVAHRIVVPVPAPRRQYRAPAPVAVHHTSRPTTPALPAPTPWTPVTVPAAPGSGGGGGAPGAGGVGLIDQFGVPPLAAPDVVRVLPASVPVGRVTVRRQPGTTPD